MQELVQAQSQDLQYVAIDSGHGARREMLGEVIELPLPAQRASDDFGGKRTIPFVGQMTTTLCQGRWQVSTFVGDGAERVKGRRTCWRGHGLVKRASRCRRWPARNSRASIGRRPSGWTCSIAIRS